jgi:hypothetical protein
MSVAYKFRVFDFKDIFVPLIESDSTGYHSSCYKKYTAVKNKDVESALSKQKALDEQSVLVESTLQPTAQPASGN